MNAKHPRCGHMVIAALLALLATPTLRSAEVAGGSPQGRLLLSNGDQLTGSWRGGDDPGSVHWETAFAEGLYAVPWTSVAGIQLAEHSAPETEPSGFGFELVGGDLIHGELLAMGPGWVTVGLAGVADPAAPCRIRRASIRRLFRRGGPGEPIYHGPRGLAGWDASPNAAWRAAGGGIATDQKRAAALLRLDLPDRLRIEVELAWTARAVFQFDVGRFGDAPGAPSAGQRDDRRAGGPSPDTSAAFSLQVVEGWLIAARETDEAADLAPLLEVGGGAGRTRLVMYIDRTLGRMIVESAAGERLAQIEAPDGAERPLTGLRLKNLDGEVQLDRLRVGRWDPAAESVPTRGKPTVVLDDGRVLKAESIGYDAAAGEFSLELTDDGPLAMPLERIAAITLPAGRAPREPPVTLLLRDGGRLGGRSLGVADGVLKLQSEPFENPCSIRLGAIRSVIGSDPSAAPPATGDAAGLALLESDGSQLRGAVVRGPGERPASLSWKPHFGGEALPLSPRASGRIVLRDQPSHRAAPAVAAPGDATDNGPPQAMLYLRSGDCLPCRVLSIDEQGVAFESPFTATRFVDGGSVKAVELVVDGVDGRITVERRERLLTLPRSQRGDPPRHLLVSTQGDYLRCRLQALDGEAAQVTVGPDLVRLDRAAVARIIWLDPPAGEEDDEATEPPVASAQLESERARLSLQAIRGDGLRLSFALRGVSPDPANAEHLMIVGDSCPLRDCRVGLNSIDALRFGDAVQRPAADTTYERWVMRSAKEPRYQPEPETNEDDQETPLIGSLAEEVDLPIAADGKLVEGKRFRVGDYRGKVLVLDFWATWCGPCMKVMPVIDRLGEEFFDRGVRVAAVNLQQEPVAIAATLDRLKITPLVAIDSDRSAARKYLVGGIPHTVIIGRDGRVRRVFVGGGGGFETKLRQALEQAAAQD